MLVKHSSGILHALIKEIIHTIGHLHSLLCALSTLCLYSNSSILHMKKAHLQRLRLIGPTLYVVGNGFNETTQKTNSDLIIFIKLSSIGLPIKEPINAGQICKKLFDTA